MTTLAALPDVLDSEYNKEFTDIIELVYGQNYLSQGKDDSTELLFKGLQLEGRSLIDFGSGMGASAFYVAKNHKATILGVDCVGSLVERANKSLASKTLMGTVSFKHVDFDDNLSHVAPSTIDIIYSKESILHVRDKAILFENMYKALKPGGQITLIDWMVPEGPLGPNITLMQELDGLDLALVPTDEYRLKLEQAGFEKVSIEPKNDKYIQYTRDNLATLDANHSSPLLDQEYMDWHRSWSSQLASFENNEVIVSLVRAEKMK